MRRVLSDDTPKARRWCFAAMNSVEPPLLNLLVLRLDGGWQLRQAPASSWSAGESGADEPGALVR